MLVMNRISSERKKKGLSTRALGHLVGVNQATISRYENGAIKVIPNDILEKIIDVLGCDFDEFVAQDPLYCSLSRRDISTESLSDDDRQLLTWFHNLPTDVQKAVRQFWNIDLSVSAT